MPKATDTFTRTVKLYWTGHYRMAEVAEMLGVSRQRVHQIVTDVFTPEFIETVKHSRKYLKPYQRRIEEKYGMPYDHYVSQRQDYLEGHRWHPVYTECNACGTTKRKHRAHGLCDTCYQRWAYHNLEKINEARKRAQRKWNARNKEKISQRNRERWLRLKQDPVRLEEFRRKRNEYYYRKKREKEEKENQSYLSRQSKGQR